MTTLPMEPNSLSHERAKASVFLHDAEYTGVVCAVFGCDEDRLSGQTLVDRSIFGFPSRHGIVEGPFRRHDGLLSARVELHFLTPGFNRMLRWPDGSPIVVAEMGLDKFEDVSFMPIFMVTK